MSGAGNTDVGTGHGPSGGVSGGAGVGANGTGDPGRAVSDAGSSIVVVIP
jgi:hypothetical protein